MAFVSCRGCRKVSPELLEMMEDMTMNKKNTAKKQREENTKRMMAYQRTYKKALSTKRQKNTHARG